ncbi:UPF0481 protein At3g47200-like [Triticum dicoccoides]|uniref:UPF0481 protein At3g47200-like n=1 Tax=Triticum dicoccoides TaxID=85692 RepID=UPI000E7B7EB3|nr:UPF0481 protein At3g47200-like [Triticum dicoccoides]
MQAPYEYQLAVADFWDGRATMEPNVWVPALPLQMTVAAPASNTDLVVSSSGQQELKLVEESPEYQHEWSNPIEVFEKAALAFEDNLQQMETKMHLFPPSMEELSKYSKPKVVSIGPYHHGSTEAIRQMESTKYAAACHFIKESRRSVEEVYGAVFTVAGQARSYYDADKLRELGVGDKDFKPMMFYDGCFLLQYMLFLCRENGDEEKPTAEVDPWLYNAFSSIDRRIFSDIVLLENQLPWVVVQKLKDFMPPPGLDMETVLGRVKHSLQARRHLKFDAPKLDDSYVPPHLLGYLRFYIVGSTDDTGSTSRRTPVPEITLSEKVKKLSMSVSVIELAEMGIKLRADDATAELKKMRITKECFTGKLFLPPVSLDDANARFLVNMAALELCITPDFRVAHDTRSTVCSYLSLLGMVTDNDTDVQELRNKLILQGGGGLTNEDALKLFTGLEKYLRPGNCYDNIIVAIENYRSHRRLRIKVYRFCYRNRTAIIATVSAIAGLAGFLGTLKSFQ